MAQAWQRPIAEQRRKAGLYVAPGAGGDTSGGGIPKYDTGRIAGLTQEQMAPGLSSLRRQMQKVQARRYASPLARREAIRGGIRGFGEALPGIQAGATRTAMGLYQPEYAREVAEWERQDRERLREEARETRRATPIGGDTYSQAYERMEAYDPFGARARFDSPDRRAPAALTAPSATGGGGLLEEWEGGSQGLGEITYTPAEQAPEAWQARYGR